MQRWKLTAAFDNTVAIADDLSSDDGNKIATLFIFRNIKFQDKLIKRL